MFVFLSLERHTHAYLYLNKFGIYRNYLALKPIGNVLGYNWIYKCVQYYNGMMTCVRLISCVVNLLSTKWKLCELLNEIFYIFIVCLMLLNQWKFNKILLRMYCTRVWSYGEYLCFRFLSIYQIPSIFTEAGPIIMTFCFLPFVMQIHACTTHTLQHTFHIQ